MPLREEQIFVGPALCCVNKIDERWDLRVPNGLHNYFEKLRKALNSDWYCVELNPERTWVEYNGNFRIHQNRWWKILTIKDEVHDTIREEIFNRSRILGVHAPNLQLDTLDSSEFKRNKSIASIIEAMRWANLIRADYFVFHLCQKDRWTDDNFRRDTLIPHSLQIFNFFAEVYKKENLQPVPCIEILEFPKYPATPYEVWTILQSCQQILPRTKLVFDLSHLWRSQPLIRETRHQGFENVRFRSFGEILKDTLTSLKPKDIFVWHLGGCWHTDTHLVPGIYPDEDPFTAFYRLDVPDIAYNEDLEMNISQALELIIDYCWQNDQPVRLILEIFERDYKTVIKAIQEINWALHQKVARRWQR